MIADPGLIYNQIELASLFAFGLVGDSLTDLNNQDYYDGNHYNPVRQSCNMALQAEDEIQLQGPIKEPSSLESPSQTLPLTLS
jgi:hypothetical protein|mmetsp:Transcript_26106/g.47148  ORF Transcript_26106/g.47148 Transcript_26106/m.47148 type:complete len:83 (+) Transcript_26106:332-580(+)